MTKNPKKSKEFQWWRLAHDYDQYVSWKGHKRFINHCIDYVHGNVPGPPIGLTKNKFSNDKIWFSYTDSIFKALLKENKELLKAHETALKYGFCGFSKGKQNGIFLLNKTDKKLLLKAKSLVKKNKDQILQMFPHAEIIEFQGFDYVKIVHHEPSGKRLVGIKDCDRIMFLGFAYYK